MASSMLSAEVEAKTIARPAGNGMGNGLFAATNIAMGQEVLRIQKPFAAVLDSPRLQDTCSGCFGIRRLQRNQGSGSGAIHDHGDDDVAELKACTRCQVVRYCDKVCRFHVTFIISLSPPLTFVLFVVAFFFIVSCRHLVCEGCEGKYLSSQTSQGHVSLFFNIRFSFLLMTDIVYISFSLSLFHYNPCGRYT
jgi:hypothetical protein